MEKSAVISECGKYRYLLSRIWDLKKPNVIFIMLNPSTADGSVDDATIRKCIGFATRWGMGSLDVINLFAYRATNPRELAKAEDPVGPDNDDWIWNTTVRANSTTKVDGLIRSSETHLIAAWGAWGEKYVERARIVSRSIRLPMRCLSKLRSGHPAHPLMQPYAVKPQFWGFEECVLRY